MIGSRGLGSNYGGIERVLDQLSPRLAGLGYQIDVYSSMDVAFRDGDGVRAIPTPAIEGKHFETLTRSMNSLVRATGRYDLIHFHAIGPGMLSAVTRLLGQKSVVTIHGLDHKRDKWGASARCCLTFAERTLVSCTNQISVVSETLRRYFIERYDMPVSFIPNGMPRAERVPPGRLGAEYGLGPRRYILFASRLTPEKGCHDLIAAFNGLDTDMKLVIAGAPGPIDYFAALRAQADSGKVVFVGHRSGCELAEIFSNAYAFVLPSYIEGMSMALLEALAYGIPVLVSDIPENRAVVEDFGFYYRPRDAVALRGALQHLIAQPECAADVANRSNAFRRPDWDDVARQYDRLYRRALQPSGARLALPLAARPLPATHIHHPGVRPLRASDQPTDQDRR